MRHYIEITLIKDVDIALYFLWSKVYQQIHLAFVETQDNEKKVKYGVAFPGYEFDEKNQRYTLGDKLRIFAPSENDLEALDLHKWLARLSDYVHLIKPRQIPDSVEKYANFKRLQPKSNNLRLARRKAKRENISLEQAIVYFEKWKETCSKAPYIHIKSQSSDSHYRLFVVKQEADKLDDSNGFSTYGLSSTSSVPMF